MAEQSERSESAAQAPGLLRRDAPALLGLAALFAVLTAWSWLKWTDPILDFGFELYVPWRLVEGDVLYRDIAYRNGPLSSYWNALCFSLLGVSLRTLVIANLAIFAAITGLLFHLLRCAFDRLGAFVACAAVLVIFGFSQYGTVGNYNYVTPYQHGQTHGLLLGLAALVCLVRGLSRASIVAWCAAGVCLGLAALTKIEMFAPVLAASITALALGGGRQQRAATRRALGSFCFAALLPSAVALALLASALSWSEALRGVSGNLPYLAQALAGQTFYRNQAGLDAPGLNLARMAASFGGVATFAALLRFGTPALVRRLPQGAGGTSLAGGVFAAVFAGFVALGDWIPWPQVGRALLATSALAAFVFVRRAAGGGNAISASCASPASAASAGPAALSAALLSVYALVLLAKLGLHPQLQHYGFALAMPAFALLTAGLVAVVVPGDGDPTARRVARALAVAAVAACASASWRASDRIYVEKTFELGSGADRILVARPERSPRGQVMQRAMRGLDVLLPADGTLLVLPEGAGLNYWLRRRNPTPYSLYLPTELAAHGGEARMLPRIQAGAPDAVVLVHRSSHEFGTGPFLRDPHNGRAIGKWLEADYRRVSRIGAPPFQGPRFGLEVLVRRDAAESPVHGAVP